jgi:hypothetical protein
MKHWHVIGCVCLAASFPTTAQSTELAISLSREVANRRPALAMTITNRSARTICLSAELLGNPDTGEIAPIGLRDFSGRPIRLSPNRGGNIPIPIAGVVRLDPGDTARAHYYIDWRFDWPGSRDRPLPRTLTAQVAFDYGYCEDAWSMRAISSWQPI